jgi:formiminotetrahydrofolate cyclodeaminase
MLTVEQLRDRIGSIEPTPGGGSASIVAGTLGVASIHKGVVVSLKKLAANSARYSSLSDLSSKTSALMSVLSELADVDSRAFQSYLEASALPRTTESEKLVRQDARQTALVRATRVPLEAAIAMGRGMKFAEEGVGLVDAHVRSEVLTGVILLRASIRSVLLNVDANLSGISDASLRDVLKQQRDKLERDAVIPADTVASQIQT